MRVQATWPKWFDKYLVRSDVVDEAVGPSVVTVDRAQVPSDKVPLVVGVPWHVLVLWKSYMKG